jgi:hypothetical protein
MMWASRKLVRGLDVPVAKRPDRVRPLVVGEQEDEVGPGRGGHRRAQRHDEEEETEQSAHANASE